MAEKKAAKPKVTSGIDGLGNELSNNIFATLSKFSMDTESDVYQTTGSVAMDLVLANGKGYPEGKMIEIAGPSTCGKSTICMFMSKVFCERGQHVLFIDLEGGASYEQLKAFGLLEYYCPVKDLMSGKRRVEGGVGIFVVVNNADTFDDVSELFDITMLGVRNKDGTIKKGTEITRANKPFHHMFIDSLKAMTPKELKLAHGISTAIGLNARSVDALLQKYKKQFERVGTTCWLINQLRTSFSGYQTSQKSTGGAALEYYADIRVQIWKDTYIKATKVIGGEETEFRKGHIAKLICREKNRHTYPDIPVSCAILYGKGVSNLYWYKLKLEAYGYLTAAGSYKDIKLFDDAEAVRLQGDGNILRWISENLDDVKKVLANEGAFCLIADGE